MHVRYTQDRASPGDWGLQRRDVFGMGLITGYSKGSEEEVR